MGKWNCQEFMQNMLLVRLQMAMLVGIGITQPHILTLQVVGAVVSFSPFHILSNI